MATEYEIERFRLLATRNGYCHGCRGILPVGVVGLCAACVSAPFDYSVTQEEEKPSLKDRLREVLKRGLENVEWVEHTDGIAERAAAKADALEEVLRKLVEELEKD